MPPEPSASTGAGWVTPLPACPKGRSRIARGEFDREVRRILPRLTPAGAVLVRDLATGRYAVRTNRSRNGSGRVRVDARYVDAMACDGLLDAVDAGFVLSELGHRRVARDHAAVDPYRAQHQVAGKRMIDGRGAGTQTALTQMKVNLAESPLGWLRRRKGRDGKALISEAQFEAGEKLRADFTAAQMTQRLTADWSVQLDGNRRGAPDAMTVSERALAARERFYKALETVGPGLSEPLVDVCCHLTGLEAAENRIGWPQRSGKVVLAIALERLADHYGFNGARPRRSRRSHVWHNPSEPGTDTSQSGQ